MSWYKFASSFMYHSTKQEFVDSILAEGLKTDSIYGLTTITKICISITRTAASLHDISPDRIKLC